MYIVVMQPNNSYVVTEYHTIYLNCIISQVYDYMSIPARLDLQYLIYNSIDTVSINGVVRTFLVQFYSHWIWSEVSPPDRNNI